MKSLSLLLMPLCMVSCVNISGKWDTIGRRDAVYDPDKPVTTRYQVGNKRYVPITVRWCEAREPWMTDSFSGLNWGQDVFAAVPDDETEPQGPEAVYYAEEGSNTPVLLSFDEANIAQAHAFQGTPLKQSEVLPETWMPTRGTHYWMQAKTLPPHTSVNSAGVKCRYSGGQEIVRRLSYAKDIPEQRTHGNRLRRPVTYALEVAELPLSAVIIAAGVAASIPIGTFYSLLPERTNNQDR